jgi:hypothetical protein
MVIGWPLRVETAVSRAVASWSTFALLTPAAVGWVRRWPLAAPAWRVVAAHLAGGLGFAVTHQVATGLLLVAVLQHPLTTMLGYIAVAYTAIDLLLYLVVVGVWHVVDSSRRLTAPKIRAARLEADLVSDDGPGLPERLVEGIGLTSVRARLGRLYSAEAATLAVDRNPAGAAE